MLSVSGNFGTNACGRTYPSGFVILGLDPRIQAVRRMKGGGVSAGCPVPEASVVSGEGTAWVLGSAPRCARLRPRMTRGECCQSSGNFGTNACGRTYPSGFVILGLDPRIHAVTVKQVWHFAMSARCRKRRSWAEKGTAWVLGPAPRCARLRPRMTRGECCQSSGNFGTNASGRTYTSGFVILGLDPRIHAVTVKQVWHFAMSARCRKRRSWAERERHGS
uniref:Uncharacterized protein n=1 Tax=Chelativorans sp. (strain BNC1) TaxID=266779 RepID=Q11IQ0_CHESB